LTIYLLVIIQPELEQQTTKIHFNNKSLSVKTKYISTLFISRSHS